MPCNLLQYDKGINQAIRNSSQKKDKPHNYFQEDTYKRNKIMDFLNDCLKQKQIRKHSIGNKKENKLLMIELKCKDGTEQGNQYCLPDLNCPYCTLMEEECCESGDFRYDGYGMSHEFF